MPSIVAALITASFTVPQRIGVNPESMLWLLPLVASIAIVYKATKLSTIKPANFLKEVVILGSIVVFTYAVIALVLCVLAWVITE